MNISKNNENTEVRKTKAFCDLFKEPSVISTVLIIYFLKDMERLNCLISFLLLQIGIQL
jgi:hypothetical protein